MLGIFSKLPLVVVCHMCPFDMPGETDELGRVFRVFWLHLNANNSLASLGVGFTIIIDYYASLLIAKYHTLLILIYAIKGEIFPLGCHLRHNIITNLSQI